MDLRWISIRVHPHARKAVLVQIGPNRFEAWVKAKPIGGLANAEVIDLLARTLQISPARIRLIKGGDTRNKLFKLVG